jgi:hypothetical protein
MAESALAKKLRLKPGPRAAILNAPEGYLRELNHLPEDIQMGEKSRPCKPGETRQNFRKNKPEVIDKRGTA